MIHSFPAIITDILSAILLYQLIYLVIINNNISTYTNTD